MEELLLEMGYSLYSQQYPIYNALTFLNPNDILKVRWRNGMYLNLFDIQTDKALVLKIKMAVTNGCNVCAKSNLTELSNFKIIGYMPEYISYQLHSGTTLFCWDSGLDFSILRKYNFVTYKNILLIQNGLHYGSVTPSTY